MLIENLPKPDNWNRFEDIIWNVYTRELKAPNLQRYGRQGQAQQGVDIAGSTSRGFIGIQCKHHPDTDIKSSEIDDEIAKSENFRPKLDEYLIVTSADRDAKIQAYVFDLSEKRKQEGKCPVAITFWQDIVRKLGDYEDVLKYYYSEIYRSLIVENITLAGAYEKNRLTGRIFSNQSEVSQSAKDSFVERGVLLTDQQTGVFADNTIIFPQLTSETISVELIGEALKKSVWRDWNVDPYRLSLGISTFANHRFTDVVDLDINWSHLCADTADAYVSFEKMKNAILDVKGVITNPDYSPKLTIYLQSRLSAAFLIGWAFRKVTKLKLNLVFGEQIWATEGLSDVDSKLRQDFPTQIDPKSTEAVFVLNISGGISGQVIDFVRTWDVQPQSIFAYSLQDNGIKNAAQALKIAKEISSQVKAYVDQGMLKKIHLFSAMPVALATLISYHLNAICPVVLYFADSPRQFKIAGELTY